MIRSEWWGVFDVSRLPVNPTGVPVTITLGTNMYPFSLESDGTFKSDSGSKPFNSFSVNISSGAFAFSSTVDEIVAPLAGNGVANVTASKQSVKVPISVSMSGLNMVQVLNAEFTGTQGKTGKINFSLGSVGTPGVGFLRITNGSVKERLTKKKNGDKIHDIALLGNITLANDKTLTKAESGVWRVTVGNYSQDIPVGSLKLSTNGLYTFKDTKTKSGISALQYSQKTGTLYVTLKGIPGEGIDPSGMSLSNNLTVRADLAVSFDLDLAMGGEIAGIAVFEATADGCGTSEVDAAVSYSACFNAHRIQHDA